MKIVADTLDEVMAGLFALEGLVTDEVCVALFNAATQVAPGDAIVEIGSYKGKSTCCLAAGAEAGRGAHVWAIDPWDLEGNETGRFGFAERSTREAFNQQVISAGFSDSITPIQDFSVNVARRWPGPRVALLYIDGDHSFMSVVQDYTEWVTHLFRGSTVIFDDFDTPKNPGVRRAVETLVENDFITYEQQGRLAVATCKT